MKTVFQHCPRCGSPSFAAVSSNAYRCPACGLLLYTNPAIAVAGVLMDPDEQVLLIRRAKEPAKGKFAFPGGFVDVGESAEAALRREAREEVGLELGEMYYLTSHPNVYPFGGILYPVVDFVFRCPVQSFEGVQALDEVAGWTVVPLLDIRVDELAFPSLREAVHVLRGGRA